MACNEGSIMFSGVPIFYGKNYKKHPSQEATLFSTDKSVEQISTCVPFER